MSAKLPYLNLGCGSRYHPAWINIDLIPHGPGVIRHDLSRGIPLPDASCAVVYHAAMLEHLRPADAATLLRECHRVLQPGGILRIGVPDLERLCRIYLEKVTAALNGDPGASDDYDWIMLELFDQLVREQSGGAMLAYLGRHPLPNPSFIYARIGNEGRTMVAALQHPQRRRLSDLPAILRRRLPVLPGAVRRALAWIFLSSADRRALAIGRFRQSGEVHQWMYDRYSLARLLWQTGFVDPLIQAPDQSRIPDWVAFQLDTLPDGQVMKPDLFFIEALKPAAISASASISVVPIAVL